MTPKTQRDRDMWMEGFIACCILKAGHRKDWDEARDRYLKHRPNTAPVTSPGTRSVQSDWD